MLGEELGEAQHGRPVEDESVVLLDCERRDHEHRAPINRMLELRARDEQQAMDDWTHGALAIRRDAALGITLPGTRAA